ncbi:MAG: ABC transporter permease [Candidatus Shapirobacteria bacterium]|nr:ABC transporter permease [Candidatus Shapirobacteria bacterium]MDD4410365.1 ABC transporter permease [Candidatus Shapirobacteria bacterium]
MLKPSFSDLLRSSFRSILKNKSRTILTSLGIIIGVTSVILLTSIGNGLKNYVTQQFDALGANSIFISPGKIFNDNGGFSQSSMTTAMTTSFTQKDFNLLNRKLKNTIIMPVNAAYADIKSSYAIKKTTEIDGSTEEYGKSNNVVPSDGNGHWFTNEENDKKTPVVVLGYKIAQTLFPKSTAIGKKVIIKGKTLKVIGVVDQKGASMGGPSVDDAVYAPFSVVSDLAGNDNINTFVVKAPNKDLIASTKKEITKVMLEKYDSDAFSVFDSSQLLSSINSIISVLTIALTGIAAISLVVGGVGIMNIMLVSVTERTREIGLRKAIGAYPRAILIQFLIEAVILSCFGGLVGVILGSLGTVAINSFFPAKITISSILLAFGVSSAVGIIFGVAPARKASKLSPIEALRYE